MFRKPVETIAGGLRRDCHRRATVQENCGPESRRDRLKGDMFANVRRIFAECVGRPVGRGDFRLNLPLR